MSYWSIDEGAITGRIATNHPCGTNQYLVWQGGELADFELRLKSRLRGSGAINNGFQFRSRVLPDGDVAGYQMDNNLQTEWLVRLYDEFGRHTLAWRGQRTVLDAEGSASTNALGEASGPAWFRLEEWHEYDLTCVGPRLTLRVNGRLAAEVADFDRRRADPQGMLALQLHSGPPTVVEFKDIRLKILKSASPAARPRVDRRRERLLERALAHWDLGTGGHEIRQPLRYIGRLEDLELNVRTDGPGARGDARVALLRGGHFEAGSDMILPATGATVFVRARDPSGRWDGVLLAQSDGGDRFDFALAATGGEIRLAVRTRSGREGVSFSLAPSDRMSWHDWVGRWGTEGLELFCDGRRVAAQPWHSPPEIRDHAPLLVGAERDGAGEVHFFHGELEEVGVWGEALDDRDLARLMPSRRATRRPSP